ncbi:hypothetical protein BKE30_07240 [Alkanindiges hydrocarboniclasticus]|uniref:Uncharacterized protein n=1 Tax=Alkanindiges hydrocarboniclasticus TaxID=1907941 RepID=A0A1S8CUB3_9GAMM|nr:hypothetical protein BKE30_07240 [Alkanindiges hydrocarboniclasticus]
MTHKHECIFQFNEIDKMPHTLKYKAFKLLNIHYDFANLGICFHVLMSFLNILKIEDLVN